MVMAHTVMPYIVMAHLVVAYTIMAYTYTVMAYTVMAYTVMAEPEDEDVASSEVAMQHRLLDDLLHRLAHLGRVPCELRAIHNHCRHHKKEEVLPPQSGLATRATRGAGHFFLSRPRAPQGWPVCMVHTFF